MADASIAHNNTLKFTSGYVRGDVVDWWSDARTPSRLGEASQNVVLARWVDGALEPWVNRKHAWAYSTVRVPERLIQHAIEPEDESLLAEYERVRSLLPGKGRWSTLLALSATDTSAWHALAAPPLRCGEVSARTQRWLYDEEQGLRLANTESNVEEAE